MVEPARVPLSNVSLSQPACQRAEPSTATVPLSISLVLDEVILVSPLKHIDLPNAGSTSTQAATSTS